MASGAKRRGLSRRLTRRGAIASAVAAVGLASGVGSWMLRNLDPWWASTLGNVAVAALLLVPAEYAISGIKSGFRRIERATDEVRATAESARSTAERAERSLEDVRAGLMKRQQAEHKAGLDIYRDIVRDPSRESLLRALRIATEEEVISSRGVRAPIWETDLHYRFVIGRQDEELVIQLEQDGGEPISVHPWRHGRPPEDFYQELVEAVRSVGRDLGVNLNDPTQSVQDLSEMLVEVSNFRAQELMGYRPYLRKIIERRDGWFFTEDHVLPADDLRYSIKVARLDEMNWDEHLRNKGGGAPRSGGF